MNEIPKRFGIRKPIPPAYFTLTESGGYLSARGVRMYLSQGATHIEISTDKNQQTLSITPEFGPGSSRYAIFNPEGQPVQVRNRLTDRGMKLGTYVHISDHLFVHGDHLEAMLKPE